MRVPNAGQDLVERRIVREGKRIAEAMLAGYRDPPDYSIVGMARLLGRMLGTLRMGAIRQ